jgi:hypothetical protein
MGGLFITNAATAVDVAARVFERKPVAPGVVRRVNDTTVAYYRKCALPDAPCIHETPEGFILGCGTYYYDGVFGPACLPKLWDKARHGFEVFCDVGGHFSFVVHRDGKLWVITDKSNTHHVYAATHGDHFFLSTSVIAIGEALPKLTLGKQEILEFINTESTFGQHTIFREIALTEPGTAIECAPQLPQRTYYELRDARVSFEQLIERFDAYFSVFRDIPRACSDLSGGYDSRTVAALLIHAGARMGFNTNSNVRDPNDHEVAQRVAKFLGRSIVLYENRAGEHDFDTLVDKTYEVLDVSRNLYRSAYTPVVFQAKSTDSDLVLGGYGGELLRDRYSKPKSVQELIGRFYLSEQLWLPRRELEDYRAHLGAKFEARMRKLGERDIKKGVEKIYCFEKMGMWGGSRTTAYNQYCYRCDPLLDHMLAKHYFDFSNDEKAGNALQKRIMEVVPGLSQIPFANDVLPTGLRKRAVARVRRSISRALKAAPPDLTRGALRLRNRGRYSLPPKLAKMEAEITHELLARLGVKKSALPNEGLLGRLATVATAARRLGSKVRVG